MKNYLFSVCLIVLCVTFSDFSHATPVCQKTGHICVDGPSTKPISGASIYRDCWNYQDTYSCVDSNPQNSCQPLIDLGCGITNSACKDTAFNGTCLDYQNNYLCTDLALATPLPNNVTLQSTSYRITSDENDASACATLASNSVCSLLGTDVCTDATPVKNINGLDVARSCWAWDRSYACLSSTQSTQCTKFSTDPSCKEDGTGTCVQNAPASLGGGCEIIEHKYTCTTGGAGVGVVASCETQKFCMSGMCFDMGYKSDKDFGSAASSMEMVREAGLYFDPVTLTMFNGTSNHCANRLWGLSTCCNTDGSGSSMSNASIGQSMGSKAIVYGGNVGYETVKAYATPYVYDMLWNYGTDSMIQRSIDAWSSATWQSTSGATISPYGFTFAYYATPEAAIAATAAAQAAATAAATAAAAAAATATAAAAAAVGTAAEAATAAAAASAQAAAAAAQTAAASVGTLSEGLNFVGFDPWSFAAAIAIQIIMDMMQCTTDEQALAMKRGQNLCNYIGDYCSSKDWLGGCMERSQGYCCYNSRLAKIIAAGGHAQLGKSYGSAENPECLGFTAGELQLIDFSKIDMSEFIAEIAPGLKSSTPATQRAQSKIQSYYAPAP